MNIFYKSLIDQTENKMTGYVALLSYRYQNLCVKADATALMPVNIMIGGEPKNIEDVAKVGITDDYHLVVFPNQDDLQPFVIDGIFHSHPEFKLEVQSYKQNDEERHFLLYEMPEVDKDRYDVLTQGVDSLHDECKVRLDEIHAENLASLTELLQNNPGDLDIVKKEFDRVHNDYVGKIKSLRDNKLEEIEEGYKRYLEAHPEESAADAQDEEQGEGYNVTLGMRMDGNDE